MWLWTFSYLPHEWTAYSWEYFESETAMASRAHGPQIH